MLHYNYSEMQKKIPTFIMGLARLSNKPEGKR